MCSCVRVRDRGRGNREGEGTSKQTWKALNILNKVLRSKGRERREGKDDKREN